MTTQTTGVAGAAVTAGPSPFPVPSVWALVRNTARRLLKGQRATQPPDAARDSLLLDAAVAIRAGRVADASRLLAPHVRALAGDPAYLNLLGAVCEVRRQWRLAHRFYGVAISIAPRFGPAQQNMRRLYELNTFGHSREPLALGDSELRRDRTVTEKCK